MIFRVPQFEVLTQGNAGWLRARVLELKYNGGMPVVMAVLPKVEGQPEPQPFEVLIDGIRSYLLQFTDCFDKAGAPIFQGHLVANEAGDIFEIIFYEGAFRALRAQQEPFDLTTSFCMTVSVVGDIVRNPLMVAPEIPEPLKQAEVRRALDAGEKPIVRGFKLK